MLLSKRTLRLGRDAATVARRTITKTIQSNGTEVSKNPVVLVTGSSRGIGRAIAGALADAGCRVVVNYSTNEKLAEDAVADLKERSAAKGGNAIAIKADVTSPKSIKEMFAKVNAEVSFCQLTSPITHLSTSSTTSLLHRSLDQLMSSSTTLESPKTSW